MITPGDPDMHPSPRAFVSLFPLTNLVYQVFAQGVNNKTRTLKYKFRTIVRIFRIVPVAPTVHFFCIYFTTYSPHHYLAHPDAESISNTAHFR